MITLAQMKGDVAALMAACGQATSRHTRTAALYQQLVREEFTELMQETDRSPEELKEALDLVWVILGLLIARGYDVEGAWQELAKSNQSKIGSDGKMAVNPETGKYLKGPNYRPADMTPFV